MHIVTVLFFPLSRVTHKAFGTLSILEGKISLDNNNTLFKYRKQIVFEKEDHEVIPI